MGRTKQFDPDEAVGRAVEVFWDKGFGATTPQDLVDALGIGKGSLYNAFGSKHELFTRALRRYADEQATGLIEFLAQPGPVRPKLAEALRRIVDMNLAPPVRRGCLAVNTAAELGRTDATAAAEVQRMFDRTEAAFETALAEGRATGELSGPGDPAEVASLLLTTVVGLQVLARGAASPDRLHRAVDALLTTL